MVHQQTGVTRRLTTKLATKNRTKKRLAVESLRVDQSPTISPDNKGSAVVIRQIKSTSRLKEGFMSVRLGA